jgi:energy-coupling factor transporter ATP-binding protein EcfA2
MRDTAYSDNVCIPDDRGGIYMSYITLKNVTFSYPGNAQEIFKVVSLQLDGSWNLGLIGRNGRGKTTLLGLLLGKYPCQGTITSDLSFAYFPYGSRTIEFAIWGDDKRPSEVPECSNKTYTGGTTDDRREGYHLFRAKATGIPG